MSIIENLAYPAILIFIGGGVSGILIPWYTKKQNQKAKELEELRKQNQLRIPLKKELLELFYDSLRHTYSSQISAIRDTQQEFGIKEISHDGILYQAKNDIQNELNNYKNELGYFLNKERRDGFRNELKIPRKNYFLLKSKIYNYTLDKELTKECKRLAENSANATQSVSTLLHSENKKDLLDNILISAEILNNNNEDLNQFAEKLINCRIRTINL